MSATGGEAQPAPPPGPGGGRTEIACPRCGAAVAADQGWCLECGLAARTRLAPTPGWRAPLLAAGGVGLLALLALVAAFLKITSDNAPLPTTAAPASAPAATAPPATTAAPVPTAPDAVPAVPPTADPAATVPPATTPADATGGAAAP